MWTGSRVSGYWLSIPTISMMSDYGEDLDDFPVENSEKPAESFVGAYRAESTDQWIAGSGITTKIPPLFDGSTSWFKCEELIDDWLELKNRLVGDAEIYKGLLDREPLRAADGVKYFRNTLRLHFIKGAQSVFLGRFYQFTRARRGNIEMVKLIGKFSLLLKRSRDAWMDMLPLYPNTNQPANQPTNHHHPPHTLLLPPSPPPSLPPSPPPTHHHHHHPHPPPSTRSGSVGGSTGEC